MSSDDRIQQVLDRALAGLRAHLVSELCGIVEELVRAAAEERSRPVREAAARLAEDIRRLDAATSLSDVLDVLTECAGRHAARVAVVLLKGDRLRGWRDTAVEAPAPGPAPLDLGSDQAGLAGMVAAEGVAASRSSDPACGGLADETTSPALPTSADAQAQVALPIIVGGSVVAVLHAEVKQGQRQPVASAWPAELEILTRHASARLETITVERATGVLAPSAPHAQPGTGGATLPGGMH